MYTLDFSGELGPRRYEIASQGFFMCRTRQIGVGEWDTAADLSRKFKSIGIATDKAGDGTQLYDLNSEKLTMSLSKAEMKLLVDMIEGVVWKPATIESVIETREWLKAATWESEIVK